MKIAQDEGVLVTRRKINIDPEQRVVRGPAESLVGDFPFPVFRGTGSDALVHHAQGGFKLSDQNRFDIVDHGKFLPECLN